MRSQIARNVQPTALKKAINKQGLFFVPTTANHSSYEVNANAGSANTAKLCD